MSHFMVLVIGSDVEKSLAPFQENNMGDAPKEFLKYQCYPKDGGDKQYFDSKEEAIKKLGDNYDEDESYMENPNAKWDWYVEGGRYSSRLTTKEGKEVDAALIGDIDFDSMNKKKKIGAEKAWDEAQRETDKVRVHIMHGIKNSESKEEYLKRSSSFSTFALIKDGKWHEKGQMGWWACVANEKESSAWNDEFLKLMEDLPTDTLITVIDCHI